MILLKAVCDTSQRLAGSQDLRFWVEFDTLSRENIQKSQVWYATNKEASCNVMSLYKLICESGRIRTRIIVMQFPIMSDRPTFCRYVPVLFKNWCIVGSIYSHIWRYKMLEQHLFGIEGCKKCEFLTDFTVLPTRA